MNRVTDGMVRDFLVWARNYGEIESFTSVAPSGRRWRIQMPLPGVITAATSDSPILRRAAVPPEIVLTSREALCFGYGCAVAGARPETRREFARREWDWS